MSLKVLLISNFPAPYFVQYANELGKKVDLTVLFELKKAADRDSSWDNLLANMSFEYTFLKGVRMSNETAFSFEAISIIKKYNFDRIIIANPTTPTGVITLLYCRNHKIPFIIQSEGGFRGGGKGIKEKFKKYLMEKADYYLTGMGGDDDYFLDYGATKERLKWYGFSSSFKKNILTSVPTEETKNNFKKELKLEGQKIILYVGQIIHRKGIDILLNAFSDIKCEAKLVIIGGKPTKKLLKIINKKNLVNLEFVDFINRETLNKYYQCADVFVLPTRYDTWGLVINEAMENALPVITTNMCVAGKQLIEDGVNGFLFESDNFIQLRSKIDLILSDADLARKMSENNLKKIRKYSIDDMAETIYHHLLEN